MSRYRKIPSEVDAINYLDDASNMEDVIRWAFLYAGFATKRPGKTFIPGPGRGGYSVDNCLNVTTSNGIIILLPGRYLVRFEDGKIESWGKEAFEKEFEPAE